MYTYMYKNIFIIYKYLYPLLLGAKTRTVALVIFFCVYVPNNYFFRDSQWSLGDGLYSSLLTFYSQALGDVKAEAFRSLGVLHG